MTTGPSGKPSPDASSVTSTWRSLSRGPSASPYGSGIGAEARVPADGSPSEPVDCLGEHRFYHRRDRTVAARSQPGTTSHRAMCQRSTPAASEEASGDSEREPIDIHPQEQRRRTGVVPGASCSLATTSRWHRRHE